MYRPEALQEKNQSRVFALTIFEMLRATVYSESHLNTASHPVVFYEKGVLKHFEKFTGKNLYRIFFFNEIKF